MKKSTLLLAVGLLCSITMFARVNDPPDCKCDFTVSLDRVVDNNTLKAKPGQIVCIKSGNYQWAYIQNFKGVKGNPIIIRNMCDGKVVVAAPKESGGRNIYAINDQYVWFDGSNNPAEKYGFEVSGGGQGIDFRDLSSGIELNNWWFHDIGYSGFNAKTDPTCDPKTQRRTDANPNGFVMDYVYFHDNKLEHILDGEGAYVGESHYADGVKATCSGKQVVLWEHDVNEVRMYNNDLDHIGRDGLQVGSATKCTIYNNDIDYFGQKGEFGQMSGIQINPGTKAEVYGNKIHDGPGFAIFAGGTGGNYIHDNEAARVGSPGDGGGIISSAYGVIDKAGNRIENNKFTDVQRVGLEVYSLTYDIDNTFTYKPGANPRVVYNKAIVVKGTTVIQKTLTLDSAGITRVYLISATGAKTLVK